MTAANGVPRFVRKTFADDFGVTNFGRDDGSSHIWCLPPQGEQHNGDFLAREEVNVIARQPKFSQATPSLKGASFNPDSRSQKVDLLSQTHSQILGLFAYEGVSRAVVNPESLRAGGGLDQDEFMQALSGVLPEFVEKVFKRTCKKVVIYDFE